MALQHGHALRADRPTGPRCVIGGRRCTGTTAENHPVVWLDDPRRHIDGDHWPATRRVWLRGVQIDLTRREFAILEYFLHHPDEVLSKRDILDHVWDFDFDGDPNIVEVYVRRLRIKLPRPGDAAMIETVRGAGYRLVAAHV